MSNRYDVVGNGNDTRDRAVKVERVALTKMCSMSMICGWLSEGKSGKINSPETLISLRESRPSSQGNHSGLFTIKSGSILR